MSFSIPLFNRLDYYSASSVFFDFFSSGATKDCGCVNSSTINHLESSLSTSFSKPKYCITALAGAPPTTVPALFTTSTFWWR